MEKIKPQKGEVLTSKQLYENGKAVWMPIMLQYGLGMNVKAFKKIWIDEGKWRDPETFTSRSSHGIRIPSGPYTRCHSFGYGTRFLVFAWICAGSHGDILPPVQKRCSGGRRYSRRVGGQAHANDGIYRADLQSHRWFQGMAGKWLSGHQPSRPVQPVREPSKNRILIL